MKTTYTVALLALLSLATGLLDVTPFCVNSSSAHAHKAPAARSHLAKVKESYSKIPLSFVPNHGQADNNVKFTSRGNGYSLALAPTSFVVQSRKSVLRATLLGANATPKLSGVGRLPTTTNYFLGSDPRQWRTNVPNYAKVMYSRVYPGVDLVFYGKQNHLEYDFIVSPGADPQDIALAFDGITGLRVDDKGDLLLRTAAGEIRQTRPIAYQQINNARRIVPASYLIKGKNRIAFQIANYDRSKPLVIDPTLAFSTYVGGSGVEQATAIAVDAAGNSYITGNTVSTDFPTTPGAFDTEKNTFAEDVFVTKLNATGTAIIYSTYFGGSNREAGNDIAVDSAGKCLRHRTDRICRHPDHTRRIQDHARR